MEARGEKINVSSGPSKEIAGLKKMMMMKMMTPELQIRVCGNSRMKRSRYVGALWAQGGNDKVHVRWNLLSKQAESHTISPL